jgi:hypothetical protein
LNFVKNLTKKKELHLCHWQRLVRPSALNTVEALARIHRFGSDAIVPRLYLKKIPSGFYGF